MLSIVVQAAENFCFHQIRLPYRLLDTVEEIGTFLAFIDVQDDEGSTRVYVGCNSKMLQIISRIFLEEDESDHETLSDMLLETANMIIGSAKVLAEELHDLSVTIATPFHISADEARFDAENMQFIEVSDGTMMVALKRL